MGGISGSRVSQVGMDRLRKWSRSVGTTTDPPLLYLSMTHQRNRVLRRPEGGGYPGLLW